MANSVERYEKLRLREALPKIYQYPTVCKELSFVLRGTYRKVPKSLQSLIFLDTLAAFRLLPEIQTGSALAAAQLLFQSAEAALPKQKRNLAVLEFKHAKVACKRRPKACQEDYWSPELPKDVLVHIFSFLDLQSLLSVGLVCRAWNFAANENHLWKLQFSIFFGGSDNCSGTKRQEGNISANEGSTVTHNSSDWKEAFKTSYIGSSAKDLISGRGYCGYCKTIVWLNNLKCSNSYCKMKRQRIRPVSPDLVIAYILDGYISITPPSDSDSDEDLVSILRLWAYMIHEYE